MNFAFLNSSLLSALLLCCIPLIIHLISRRQPRKISFAAIEFVLRSQKRTARNWKLQKLLLLLLRTLLIALFIFAIAQPLFEKKTEQEKEQIPLATLWVIDASGSMRARVDGKTRFSAAKKMAQKLLERSAKETQTGLLRCGATAELLAPPSFQRAQWVQLLNKMQAGYSKSNVTQCIERAIVALSRIKGEGERQVVVLSDLAAHAFKRPIHATSIDGLVLRFIRTDDETLKNHALHDVKVMRRANKATGDVEVSFSVSSFSASKESLDVDLFVGEEHVANRHFDDVSEDPNQASFFFHSASFLEKKSTDHKIEQRLDDKRPILRLIGSDDALAEDHLLNSPLDLPSPTRILLIDGAPQPIPFRDEIYYLESALLKKSAHRPPVTLKIVNPDDVKPILFLDADVVVLANVARLPDDSSRALRTFVKNGGGLLITSGDQIDVQWMNHALADILPGRLRGEKENKILDDKNIVHKLSFSGFKKKHPIFRAIRSEQKEVVKGLAQAQTSTLMLLEPDASIAKTVLMLFDNGAPALVERRVEKGRVLLWLTSIDRDWSDTAIRPGFLPLVQQITFYLADALRQAESLQVEAGESIQLPIPRGATALEVLAPNGNRTHLEVADATDAGLSFSKTDVLGIYRVFIRRDKSEAQELIKDRFAVRFPLQESDLRPIDEAALHALAPKGAKVEGGPEQKDLPLWPYLLLALPLVFLAESMLVRKN